MVPRAASSRRARRRLLVRTPTPLRTLCGCSLAAWVFTEWCLVSASC